MVVKHPEWEGTGSKHALACPEAASLPPPPPTPVFLYQLHFAWKVRSVGCLRQSRLQRRQVPYHLTPGFWDQNNLDSNSSCITYQFATQVSQLLNLSPQGERSRGGPETLHSTGDPQPPSPLIGGASLGRELFPNKTSGLQNPQTDSGRRLVGIPSSAGCDVKMHM